VANKFGGIYLFRNRAAAESFFSTAWFAKVKKKHGVDANVRYFSSPIQIEGTKAAANPRAHPRSRSCPLGRKLASVMACRGTPVTIENR
jgi:hypothetical protein